MISTPHSLLLAWLLTLMTVSTPIAVLYAQEHSVRPGVNRQYQSPDFRQWVRIFESPGREVFDKRHAIVSATGVKPGMAVADIGAGTGLFTRLFSPRVGAAGHVIAVDISQEFIDNILRLSRQSGMQNVQGVVNTPIEVALPEGSIDLAFICDTYHHFEYPHAMMRSVHRALRPGGTVVVIDFRRIPGHSSQWVMSHVRAGKETTIGEIEQAGFELMEELGFLRANYFLRFRKE